MIQKIYTSYLRHKYDKTTSKKSMSSTMGEHHGDYASRGRINRVDK